MAVRDTEQNTTCFSSYQILFGQKMRTPLECKYKIESQKPNRFTNENEYIKNLGKKVGTCTSKVFFNINKSAECMRNKINRSKPPLQVGSLVLVKKLQHERTHKLCPCIMDLL